MILPLLLPAATRFYKRPRGAQYHSNDILYVHGPINFHGMPHTFESWRGSSARVVALSVLLASAAACGGAHLNPVLGGSGGAPATFVATTSETRSARVIDVRDGVTKTAAFRAATEMLTQRYSVDVSDQRAGFLMTPWQATVIQNGVPDLRYRMRVVVRFVGDDWKQVIVRAEANWQRGDEWDIGYDSKVLDDVANDLRARIGKKTP